MKRFHVHISVDDLNDSVRFYSTLFNTSPTVEKPDYAKWMLDDPRINFAISKRGAKSGLDHIGIQTECAEELTTLHDRMHEAGIEMLTQNGQACCYSESDKHWAVDPSGIAWETYHTLGTIPTFNHGQPNNDSAAESSACCAPTCCN